MVAIVAVCSDVKPPLCFHRLGVKGQRQLVFVNTAALLAHLTAADGGKPVPLSAVNNWVKTTTEVNAKAFASASKTDLFCCTVGSQDAVYCPAGFTFYEKVTGPTDFAGIRLPVVSLAALEILTNISRHLIKIEAPSAALQRTLDCLALAE